VTKISDIRNGSNGDIPSSHADDGSEQNRDNRNPNLCLVFWAFKYRNPVLRKGRYTLPVRTGRFYGRSLRLSFDRSLLFLVSSRSDSSREQTIR